MPHIDLTQGKRTRVDPEDVEELCRYTWCVTPIWNGWCASRRGRGKFHTQLIRMHRQILGLLPGDGQQVDHINHDTLDNRRCNLRICTQTENMRNRQKRHSGQSRWKGVCRNGRNWRVRIRVKRQLRYLGTFSTEIEAARVYDKAAREIFGEFACVNFPQEGEQKAI